ncbi:non-reducing end alpha-L-arabinofuranosidase family hydrolase [Sorangium sp. So ce233]|uniref:non-reducing end alpha-L-arabinofuranosidase family hydrolase n=1 Tax=Sorangium sp. So ce233 TaxID=3133290 RepID=UPI003F647988
MYLNFTDFFHENSAEQHYMASWTTGSTVAPQVSYVRPHNKWYLIYQGNGRYSTNDDINNMNGWSRPQTLLRGEPNKDTPWRNVNDHMPRVNPNRPARRSPRARGAPRRLASPRWVNAGRGRYLPLSVQVPQRAIFRPLEKCSSSRD